MERAFVTNPLTSNVVRTNEYDLHSGLQACEVYFVDFGLHDIISAILSHSSRQRNTFDLLSITLCTNLLSAGGRFCAETDGRATQIDFLDQAGLNFIRVFSIIMVEI